MKSGKGTDVPCRVVVMGSSGVGKSALVVRYLTKRFIWEYDPTLECAYKHQTVVDDEVVTLDILDTAGQHPLGPQTEGHVRWGDGFLLLYSVIDRPSFDHVTQMKRHLDDVRKARHVSCVIVGNKSDLEHERRVTTEEGEQLAADLGCAFFEISVCAGSMDIPEVFHEVWREVRRRRAQEGKPQRRRSSAQQVKHVISKIIKK